jgi:capsid portal protein
MVKDRVNHIRTTIKILEEALEKQNKALKDIEDACEHIWSEVVYESFIQDKYVIDNTYICMTDPHKLKYNTIPETKHRWKRICQICDKVEYTTEFEEEKITRRVPKF